MNTVIPSSHWIRLREITAMVSESVIRHRRMALTMSSSCAKTMLQAAFFITFGVANGEQVRMQGGVGGLQLMEGETGWEPRGRPGGGVVETKTRKNGPKSGQGGDE